MMKKQNKSKVSIALTIVMLIYVLLPFVMESYKVFAVGDPLTDAEMRFYRLKVNTAVTNVAGGAPLLIKFTPGTTATENNLRVTFAGTGTLGASSYGVNSTATNITTSESGMPAGCTGPTVTSNHAAAVSGAVVDFGIADLTPTTTYCFWVTGGITSPQSAGSYTNTITTQQGSNSDVESSQVVVAHITDDQVVISAVVPPIFTFALGANTTSFTANLSTSARTYTTGVTGTIGTNANSGWTAYLRSANGALDSALTGDSIPTTGSIDGTPSTATNGSKAYLLDVDETSDANTNGSIKAEYDGNDSSTGGTFNNTDLEAFASGTGPTSNYVFTMKGLATISATTKAANDYTDTWTVVAAANF